MTAGGKAPEKQQDPISMTYGGKAVEKQQGSGPAAGTVTVTGKGVGLGPRKPIMSLPKSRKTKCQSPCRNQRSWAMACQYSGVAKQS